jgi:ribosomal protein S18 acetylase RimI-like enzyme
MVAMIELVEKSEANLATWLSTMWIEYHADLLAAGMSIDEADRNVERNRATLLDGERPSLGQHIFDVVSDGDVVGILWLGHQPSRAPNEWFIYNIAIDEGRRGTGLGRATMVAAEEYVRSKSGTRLGLNVFGANTVARRLYESLDYQTMSVSMYKDLP